MMKEVLLLKAGHCSSVERVSICDGSFKKILFPATFGVMSHKNQGTILFDTGYSAHFFEASKQFPYSLYPMAIPVSFRQKDAAYEQLNARGISPNKVKNIIISHFHGDHIAGLKDFPQATFICSKHDYDFYKQRTGVAAISHGFLPLLVPMDFERRTTFIESSPAIPLPRSLAPFTEGYDILGDGSVIAVALPGHSIGQYGCRAVQQNIPPSKLVSFFFDDFKKYKTTLAALHQLSILNPSLRIIPSHCIHTYNAWGSHE
jgi:glyoxylase-like metal-dependent hydrolase (beta-lactamase superfamily II)